MCKWGEEVLLRVPIPAEDSHTGMARWAEKPIDSCLADIVGALNAAGLLTRGSCCGHGKAGGRPGILLQDGRELLIQRAPDETACIAACQRCDDTGITETGYTCRACSGRSVPYPECAECFGSGMELEECECVKATVLP